MQRYATFASLLVGLGSTPVKHEFNLKVEVDSADIFVKLPGSKISLPRLEPIQT